MAEPGARAGVQADSLTELARSTYLTRRMRRDLFDADLFGEPAWDILLLLYSASDGASLRFEELASELECPISIVKRWLAILEARGLVEGDDRKVMLSAKGRQSLRQYLKRQVAALAALMATGGKDQHY